MGGGEDKVGKVTIEFAVLKEGPMVLSLMHWAKPLPLSGPLFLLFPIKQGSFQLSSIAARGSRISREAEVA